MKNRKVLITGGTSGIGESLVKKLHQDNLVIVCGRTQSNIDRVSAKYPSAQFIPADIAVKEGQDKLYEFIENRHGGLDVLINNAGVAHFTNLRDEIQPHHFKDMDVNFKGTVGLTSRLLPLLKKATETHPTIVIISSILAKVPNYDLSIYSASKAALHTYSLSLRAKHPFFQIVEVFPPLVDTPMAEEINQTKMSPDKVAEDIIKGIVRGKREIYPGIARVANIMSRWWPKGILKMINQ